MNSLSEMMYRVGNSLLDGALKRVLTGAGLGLATYVGMSKGLEKIISDANAQLANGDGYVLSILGLGGVDTALSIVLSAYVVRLTLYGGKVFLVKE